MIGGMKAKIGLITLGVTDLERSVRFYRDGLGLPLEGDASGIAFFRMEGTWLALYPRAELAADARVEAEGSGFRAFALAHNVPSKEAVREVLELAERAGATIAKPAEDTFWGGYSGYFADPDGFLWEVAWNPFLDLT